MKSKILGLLAVGLLAGPSHAAQVAVFGTNSNAVIVNFLNSNGHTATDFGAGAPVAAQLIGVDAVIALRQPGNNDVANFVANGGLLITEWFAAEWALDVASLLSADGGTSVYFGTNTPITQTALALSMGLGIGLPNPYADGQRTEFQWTLSNIGAGVDLLATRPGNIPVIIGGASGAGYALINSLDWADAFASGNNPSGTWLLNALGLTQVPEPGTLALLGLGLVGLGMSRRRKLN